ncbi:zinc-ribbon domain-containing protein [Microbacterium invictum]|uniref:Treble clef zinc finger domain-containing protein n=1 Tax=Microbacterium invictum TaxID=515415 RepID=A0AA40SQK1_9MICO|nr:MULTISPECIES: zinc-ribbon domain-containing protein [Microbacterium]MBB4140427.1 hypothetical protein [Microbacterium invictum]
MTYETPESFERRLHAANGMQPNERALVLLWRADPARQERAVERFGGLTPGHFAAQRSRLPCHEDGDACEKCVTGVDERYACVRCTAGANARQYAHDGPRVCRRHRRWTGPGPVDTQIQVAHAVMKADARYRALRRLGRVDANRLTELEDMLDRWAAAELGAPLAAPARFTLAVRIAQMLAATTPSRGTVSDQYTTLDALLRGIVGGPCTVLADAVWVLRRPVPEGAPRGIHDFALTPSSDGVDATEHLGQRRTCTYPRGVHLHESQYLSSTGRTGRTRTTGHHVVDYACSKGHRFATPMSKLARAGSSDGCAVCSKRIVISGINSLADTHPPIAAQWHPTANGELSATQVAGGSGTPVTWLCDAGHTFVCTPNQRTTTGGVTCGYCSNQRADPAINALSLTHPHIAAHWHPTRNGTLTAHDVVAGSSRRAWWVCPEGHELERAVGKRVKSGVCTVCTGRTLTDASSLAARHPEVAGRWHSARNGGLTPDKVGPRSAAPVWWVCDKGHEFRSKIRTQAEGGECLICSGQAVDTANSIRTLRPDRLAEFHPTRNGDCTPDNTAATSRRKLWWRCAQQHEWNGHISAVRRGTACPYCRRRKLLSGFNDLATVHPELVREWHPTNNGTLTPSQVLATSFARLWWLCTCGLSYVTTQGRRQRVTVACPSCSRKKG